MITRSLVILLSFMCGFSLVASDTEDDSEDSILQDRSSIEKTVNFLMTDPKEIYFMRVSFDENKAQTLALTLGANKSLTKITCDEMSKSLTGKAGFYLAEAFSKIPTLRILRLFNDAMTDNVAQGIALCTQITELDLANYQFSENQAQYIGQVIKNNMLKKIKLADNKIKKNGGKTIIESLKCHQTITDITLKNNQVVDIGLKEITDVLCSIPLLTCVDFEQGYLDDNQISYLAHGLDLKIPYTRIALKDSCEITDEGLEVLANSLQANETITSFTFKNMDFGGKGHDAIVSVLFGSKTIKKLDLSGTPFKGEKASLLIKFIGQNQRVTSLILRCCGIQMDVAARLTDALAHNWVITEFDLADNNYAAMGASLNAIKNINARIKKYVDRNISLANDMVNLKVTTLADEKLLEIVVCDHRNIIPWEVLEILLKNIIIIWSFNQE